MLNLLVRVSFYTSRDSDIHQSKIVVRKMMCLFCCSLHNSRSAVCASGFVVIVFSRLYSAKLLPPVQCESAQKTAFHYSRLSCCLIRLARWKALYKQCS